MNITSATDRGTRPYQEDRFRIVETPEGVLLGVFDGHGGAAVATKCAASLEETWAAARAATLTDPASLSVTIELLNRATQFYEEGSTASLAYIPKDAGLVHISILGDSPVLVVDGQGNVNVSPEHNVRSNEKEAEAAKSRGGMVRHGYLFKSIDGQGLQMSRALGDAELASVLDRTPEIYSVPISTGSTIVVATDGLYDPAHNLEDAYTSVALKVIGGATAQDLVDYAVHVPTRDNVTAIVARI